MILLLLFPWLGLHAVSLPLSGLRSCLLLQLQTGPPVVGEAAITIVAVLVDSFGERVTFRGRGELGPLDVAWLGRHDISPGMLCSQRQTPAGVCLWRQPSECCVGLLQLLGMPAVPWRKPELLLPAPHYAIPAPHWQCVPQHREVRDEGWGGGRSLPTQQPVPVAAEGASLHFWATGVRLSHILCEEGKRRRSGPALRTVVASADFSAGRTSGVSSNKWFPWS